MVGTVAPVGPIRPGLASRYGDTQTLNFIRALGTSASGQAVDKAAACIEEIVALMALRRGGNH